MRVRIASAIVVSLGLAACSPSNADSGNPDGVPVAVSDGADVRACVSFVMDQMEAPDSFVQLSATRVDEPISADAFADLIGELGTNGAFRAYVDLMERRGLKLRKLTIESAGDDVLHRTDVCRFELVAGELPESDELERRVERASSDRRFRNLARLGLVAGLAPENVPPEPEFPCCLVR